MGVVRIDVLCMCDGCAKRFGIEVETSEDLPTYDDFEHLARETIRGGQTTSYTWGVRGKATVDRFPLSGEPTIQGGYMLCDVCTQKCDDLPVECDRNLTRIEVEKTLGLPHTAEEATS